MIEVNSKHEQCYMLSNVESESINCYMLSNVESESINFHMVISNNYSQFDDYNVNL